MATLAGCGAHYTSLIDASASDAAVTSGNLATDGGATPQVIATGAFVKGQENGGDTGRGTGSLMRDSDGTELAVFGDDFVATQVPAPEVVLTARAAIGSGGIQPGDLDLGPLRSAAGAQSYSLPPDGDGGRRNLFVYCVTFGIDVTVARLQ